MSTRKYGVHLINAVPDYDAQPPVLVGDVEFPYVMVSDVQIPLPCGLDEVVVALAAKGVSIPDDKQRSALLSELQIELGPLAKKVSEVVAKRQLGKRK